MARAQRLLSRLKSYEQWLAEGPKSEVVKELYWRIKAELEAMAAGRRLVPPVMTAGRKRSTGEPT